MDCTRRTLKLVNTGDISITNFINDNLTKELKIIGMKPDSKDSLKVGDTLEIEIEYCPRKAGIISGTISTISLEPCFVLDSNFYEGIAYAPIFEVNYDVTTNFIIIDTITVQLGDTLIIPIYNEKDFSSVINGKEYWIEKLNFDSISLSCFESKKISCLLFLKSNSYETR